MTRATHPLLLVIVCGAVSATSQQRNQMVDRLQSEEIQRLPLTDHMNQYFINQHVIRARRSAEPAAPKRFGFSFGSQVSPTNDAKKREIDSGRTTSTTTERPVPFWKQRTSTTERPTTLPFWKQRTSTTTEPPLPFWKKKTSTTTTEPPVPFWKQTTSTTTTEPPLPFWKQRTSTTERPVPFWKQRASTTDAPSAETTPLTTRRTFPKWVPPSNTATPDTAATTKRTIFKWNRTSPTSQVSTTTNRPLPKWLQRTTPTTTTTTERPTVGRSIINRWTTTNQPTTRRFFTKRPTTVRLTTTEQTTLRTTTQRPKPTIRRVTTERPTVAARGPSPTTKPLTLFSPRGALGALKQGAHATRRPFRFSTTPSKPSRTSAAPKSTTSAPKRARIPSDADPLTSLLMEIASLEPRRTVGSPSVLLAIAALASPSAPGIPAVRLSREQQGFQLSLKHPPEGACAPCMPTFLVDLDKCHPCVVIR